MQIKVDEDLPQVVAEKLRARGYQATTVLEEAMGGFKDSALWAAIQLEKKFLMTADKGFADLRTHPPGTHAGVLLLRPDEDGIRPLLSLVDLVLDRFDLRQLAGMLVVVTPRAIRLRRGAEPSQPT